MKHQIMSIFTKHLSEPWFTLIKLGIKTCEGRLDRDDFNIMTSGDFILFQNNDFGFLRSFCVKIVSDQKYDSFKEYLENETLKSCLPGIETIEDGISIYYNYYKKEDEASYKIKAFRLVVYNL